MTDDELMAELRRLARSVDPIPDEVTAYARAALGWRRVDAELAELLADSRLEADSLARSEAEPARTLSFRADDLELVVELQEGDGGILVLGQLAPAAAADVGVQRDDQAMIAGGRSDELGRFRLQLSERGRMRFLIRRDPPAPPIETSWFDA